MRTEPNGLLDDIKIASPCTASWDAMKGSDTVRFCGECKLNVYNISNMKAADAAALVGNAEGRLCVRLYQRKDGTVMTRDCPVGFRAAVKRATRAAGAALTMVLGLFSSVGARTAFAGQEGEGGQATSCEKPPEPQHIKMGKIALPPRRGEEVSLAVVDDRGATIEGARVALTNPETGEIFEASLEDDGRYRLRGVEPGLYTLTVTSEGFEAPLPKSVRVRQGRALRLGVTLHGEPHILMGGIAPR